MIDTRLTRALGLTCPVVLAPMAGVAGGQLAAAVSEAGGLGLIGTGTSDWTETQFTESGREAIGIGFVTSQLTEDVLKQALTHRLRAIYLAHGDPRPFASMIHAAKVRLICQVQDLSDARLAVEAGAQVVVAQGAAAGGPSGPRSTLSLVPEVADYLHHADHDMLLLAAGGIADARGLAAAIVMGADGVVMGTRFRAAKEALVTPAQSEAILAATGDSTLRTDTGHRVLEQDRATELGEAAGLIQSVQTADEILTTLSAKAERLLTHAQRTVISKTARRP